MAWIYLAESEESEKLSTNGSKSPPIVKETHTLKACCCREWPLMTSTTLPFGTTFHRLQEPCFQKSTSSSEGSPARTSAVPDLEKAWAESEADYFSKSSGSLAKLDRASSSWKTCQLSGVEEQTLSAKSWPAWGMICDGQLYPQQKLARTTSEKDGSCLPGDGRMWMTPKAGNCGMTARTSGRPLDRSTHLQAQVHLWRTPLGTDGEKSGHGNLPHQVKLATPQARDYRTGQTKRFKNKNRTKNPNDQIGGQLNPTWVELLMGYPPGWTDLT